MKETKKWKESIGDHLYILWQRAKWQGGFIRRLDNWNNALERAEWHCMKMNKEILMIFSYYGIGGAQRRAINLANEMVKNGYKYSSPK